MQGCSDRCLYARCVGYPVPHPTPCSKGLSLSESTARDFPLKVPGRRAQPAKMGLAFTKLFARLFSKKEMRILMVRRTLPARCSRCRLQRRSGRIGRPARCVIVEPAFGRG